MFLQVWLHRVMYPPALHFKEQKWFGWRTRKQMLKKEVPQTVESVKPTEAIEVTSP